MELIRIKNLSKSYPFLDKPLFTNASFSIKTGNNPANVDKIGLIGPNGSGKSTLLNIIAGRILPDQGQIVCSKDNLVFGILEQGYELSENTTVYDNLYSAIPQIHALENEMRHLEKSMTDNAGKDILGRYANILEEYDSLDGYNYSSRIEKALDTLGLDIVKAKTQIVNQCSGGEKTKLNIARLIVQHPDLLLLDEPSTHLDIESIKWLENFLINYPYPFMIVSHDQMLMENVCNSIIEIDMGKVHHFPGKLSEYIKEKELLFKTQMRKYENNQKQIHKLKEEVIKRSVWAHRTEKGMKRMPGQKEKVDKSFVSHKSSKMMKRAITVKKKLEKVIETSDIEKPKVINEIKMSFQIKENPSKIVCKLENINMKFGSRSIINDFSLLVSNNDRIALIGNNGSGKTTLLKIMAGKIKPDSGEISYGNNIDIGYFSQQLEELDFNNKVLDELLKVSNDETRIRKILGTFNIRRDNVFKTISELSFGQITKVLLTKLMVQRSNFLIMDEPTNYLDIRSREGFLNILEEYSGTLIIATHDRYLIKNATERIIRL